MILVEQATPGAEAGRIEIVERKGLGHPDTICDAVAEAIAVALVAAYREMFGFVPHFNADKALLLAGWVEHRFGGGRLIEPARFVVGDRATFVVAGKRLRIEEIVEETIRTWIRTHLPNANPDLHYTIQTELRPASRELARLMEPDVGRPLANDTSALVGFAPLTPTERLVLALERYLNGKDFKRRFPGTGEDVKVLAIRRDGRVSLTVAMPILDRAAGSEKAYFRTKEAALADLGTFAASQAAGLEIGGISLNALDARGRGVDGVYLSFNGTSADGSDSGEVGRGNRVNGLISLSRPAAGEAAAGKNPFCHVGKIYAVLANRIADRIHREVEGVSSATVWLASRIGSPVDEPETAAARVGLAKGAALADVERPVRDAIGREIAAIGDLSEELARGEHPVF